jgi:hypothetical protein
MFRAWRDHHMPPAQFAALSEGEKVILLAFAEFERENRR